MEYTRRDLAQAVLDAHPDSKRGLDVVRGGFSEDVKAHQIRLRDGLLQALHVDPDAHAGLNMMLRATVRSNAAITNPMSNFVEAGLIVTKVEGTGVLDKVDEIAALNQMSAKTHLGIVEELLGPMNPAVDTVTSHDLQVIGVDDTPPNRFDYEMDF